MQQEDVLPPVAAYLIEAARMNDGKAPSVRDLARHVLASRGQAREALVIERRAKSGLHVDAGIAAMSFFARCGLPLENPQILEAVAVGRIHEIKAAGLAASRAIGAAVEGAAG